MTITLLCLIAIVCTILAALIAAAESAWNFVPRHDVEKYSASTGKSSLVRIQEDFADHINAMRFWLVWFEMAAAVAVTLVFAILIDNIWLAGLVATAVMAGIGFVLVGASPRQIGRNYPLAIVRFSAPLVRFLRAILGPVPRWLIRLGNRLSPGNDDDTSPFVTEAEFREIVDRASDQDVLEDSEADLIKSVFEIGDTRVREVMVPRMDVVGARIENNVRQVMSLFLRSGFSRMPVFGENSDDVRGMLYLKDVAAAMLNGYAEQSITELMRDVQYVPDSKSVADLLTEMQHRSAHIAIVVDEYGGTAGLVTLEDLIEEIVGEIVDEYDQEPGEQYAKLEDGGYRVSARMSVGDLAELMDVDLEDDDVDTVGGLLAKELGMVPIVGSEVKVGDLALRAHRSEGRRNRIAEIDVHLADEESSDEELAHDPVGEDADAASVGKAH